MPRALTLPLAALAITLAGSARAFDFSVDPASPEVARLQYGPSDIIHQNGAGVHLFAAGLGLGADQLDGFSYGKDLLRPLGPNFYVSLQFSVSRGAVGAGGVVTRQATGNGAAGDEFALLILRSGRTVGPFLESDAPGHALTPLPPSQSDIDGLSYPAGAQKNVYYTVARGGAKGASDVYFVAEPGATAPVLYASASQLGLGTSDNIDALAVKDGGTVGVLDSGDIVYVSLDTQSPTRASVTGGSEGILQVFPLPIQVALPYTKLDVSAAASEEIDAITAYDPGPEALQLLTARPVTGFGLLSGQLDLAGPDQRYFGGVYTGAIDNRAYYTLLRPGLEADPPSQLALAAKFLIDSDLHVVKGGLFPMDRGSSLVDTTNGSQGFHYFAWLGAGLQDVTVIQSGDPIPGTALPMQGFNHCGVTVIGNRPCFFATLRDSSFRPYWSAVCRDAFGLWTQGATFMTQGTQIGGRTIAGLQLVDCSPQDGTPNVTSCYGPASTSTGERVMLRIDATGSAGAPVWGTPSIVLDAASAVPGAGTLNDMGFQTAAGSVVFHGRTTTGAEGIYRLADGALTRIADKTTPVPGGTGTFLSFGEDVSNDEGAVTFVGFSAGGQGVYTNLTGRLQKVVQVNDVIGGRTVSGVTLARDAAARTTVAFGARFSDGFESVVVKELPLSFDTTDVRKRAIQVDVELDPDPAILGPDPRALLVGDLGTARLQGIWTSNGVAGQIRLPGREVARLLALQFGAVPVGVPSDWIIAVDIATGAVLSSTASGALGNGPFAFDGDTNGGPWTSPLLGVIGGASAGFETDAGGQKRFCSNAFSQIAGGTCGSGVVGFPAPAAYDRKSGFVHQTGPLTLGSVVLWGFLGDQRWLEAAPGSCVDADADGVCDAADNCIGVANPAQIDADADAYGNACDADLSQDGIVNFVDLARLKAVFFKSDAVGDLSGDGVVNFLDLAIMKKGFFKAPGPAAGKP